MSKIGSGHFRRLLRDITTLRKQYRHDDRLQTENGFSEYFPRPPGLDLSRLSLQIKKTLDERMRHVSSTTCGRGCRVAGKFNEEWRLFPETGQRHAETYARGVYDDGTGCG